MKAIVCGYGNPSRQDDGAGHVLAPKIAGWLGERGIDVRLECSQQLLPELAEDLADADLAVFVDASVPTENGEDATCRWGEVRELSPDPALEGANLHSMGPEWLLDLMDMIHLRRPRAILVTVTGVSFDFADMPTPLCLSRVDIAFETFTSFIDGILP